MLGYGYWQSRFGGDPGMVLKTIRLNGRPVQVVGIAKPEFGGLIRQGALLWMPISQYPYLAGDNRLLMDNGTARADMLGRLKRGVSLEAAESQVRALTVELGKRQPQFLEQRARRAGIPAIYVNDNFGKWRSNTAKLLEYCLRPEAPGRRFVEQLRPDEEDYLVLKPMHSALYQSPLDVLLRHVGASP